MTQLCPEESFAVEGGVGTCRTEDEGFAFVVDSVFVNLSVERAIEFLAREKSYEYAIRDEDKWIIACSGNALTNCELLADELDSLKPYRLSSAAVSTTESSEPESSVATTVIDGTYIVGEDIQPGTYRNDGSTGSCYWERLSGFGGTLQDVIANDNPRGQAFVTISPTDAGFASTRCGKWELVPNQ